MAHFSPNFGMGQKNGYWRPCFWLDYSRGILGVNHQVKIVRGVLKSLEFAEAVSLKQWNMKLF